MGNSSEEISIRVPLDSDSVDKELVSNSSNAKLTDNNGVSDEKNQLSIKKTFLKMGKQRVIWDY